MSIKNILKIMCLMVLVFTIFSGIYEVSAVEVVVSPWSDYNQFDDNVARVQDHDDLKKVFQTPIAYIISVVRTIAVIVAICMILWAAIRYMAPNFTLFGKALDKAEVKRDIPRFVIASVLLFGTSGLLTFIQYVIEDVLA